MSLAVAKSAARYLRVDSGQLTLDDNQVVKRTHKGQECSGLATIISQLFKESKNSRWTNSEQEYLVFQWLEYASIHASNKTILKDLNSYLENCSYLVGYNKTIADVVVYHTVYDLISGLSPSEKESLIHVCRWFSHIQSDEEIRQDKTVVNFATNYAACKSNH